MTNKKIAIWGCGDIGHKFIKKYKDKVKIDCIIDSKVKNQKLINIEGTEYSIFNPEYLRTNPVFVIVCIKNSKEQIYSKLKEFGMTMFNDFVPYTEFDEDSIDSEQLKYVKAEKYIEQRRKKRKIAAFYGTCHMAVYKDSLKRIKAFTDEYVILDLPLISETEAGGYPFLKEKWIWEKCNLVVANQIFAINSYGVWDTQKVLDMAVNAKKIIITNAYFEGYFPQWCASRNPEFRQIFAWEDKNINRMIEQAYSDNEIIARLKDKDFYKEDEITQYFEKNLNVLKKQEQLCDIKMCDYVSLNKNRRILFRSWTHPTDDFFVELIRRLLNELKIKGEPEVYIKLNVHEQIIYPSVIKALNIVDYDTFQRTVNPGDITENLNFEQYIVKYISTKKRLEA